jgi:hypothetical protein
MASYFSEQLLADMRQHRRTVLTRHANLQARFMSRSYKTTALSIARGITATACSSGNTMA